MTTRGLWREPDFLKLWAGQAVSQVGSWITLVGLPLTAALMLKASPLQMGILNGVGAAAILLFGLFAGAWADRLRRRPILIWTDLGRAAVLGTVPLAAAYGRLTMGHLYLVAAACAALNVFFDVSYQAYLPSLVSPENILEGNSKMSLSASIAGVVGPGLTGALVAAITAPMAILFDAISFVGSAISVWLIRKPEPPPEPNAAPHMGREIMEGLRASWQEPILRTLLLRSATASIFLGFGGSLYILFAVRELGLGAVLLGAVIAVGGCSGVFGALIAERLVRRFGVGQTLIGAALLVGVAGLLPPFAHGPVALCAAILAVAQLGDMAWSIYDINELTLRQAIAPSHVLGRVNAAAHLMFRGLLPAGALLGGALAEKIGLRGAMFVGGAGFLLSTLWLIFSPIRRLRALPLVWLRQCHNGSDCHPMSELVQYTVQDDVAVITINNPPVNALSPGVPEGIDAGVARAAADPSAKAVVLIGAGNTFIAGADIKVFGTIPNREVSIDRSHRVHALLRRIEDCPKPVVCAIHGTALGGGLEFAMACHYRVAVASAKVGQPEVLLGIIPGAAGTQRLPRLCGVATAVELCTQGQHIGAKRALAEGIIDQIVEGDLLTGAIAFARVKAAAGETRKVREQSSKIADRAAAAAALDAARVGLKKTARGAHAPYAAVEAIEAGVLHGFDAGSEREIELFANCVLSAESRNLIRLFFAEREAAKVPGVPKDTPTIEIRAAAVVGAGTMGGGIAMNYANSGIPVLLKESSQEALDRGLATIRKNYDISASKGKMTPDQVDRVMSLIRPTLTYDGFDQVDIVVEAVFENLELKKSVFADLGRVTKPDCVLASNTSTLDIDQFAQSSGRPANVIGHHFFSPANVMKLMEIVRGRESSSQTIATSLKLAKKLNKVGVVVGNCFGFVANRMLAYYMREGYLLLEEGASVPQIDQVMTGFGMPVGPFGMQDIAGIDVGARIRQYLRSIGKSRAEGPESPVPDWLYEMGRYGQKTGAGWYRYEAGSRTPIPDPLIEELAEKAARERGITRQPVSDDEILSRIMVALANEGANVLDEHIAIRPGDIDVIYAYGFGYPRHRGGPMAYADSLGLPHVLAKVKEYRARLGDHWQPAPLLERLAAAGKGFYDAAASASAG